MVKQGKALLRICASCEFIFRWKQRTVVEDCPLCGFGSYSARWVLGTSCYRQEKTQQVWRERQHNALDMLLDDRIQSVRLGVPIDLYGVYRVQAFNAIKRILSCFPENV